MGAKGSPRIHLGKARRERVSTVKTSLSVLDPVYNEQHLAYTSLQRLKLLENTIHLDHIEVIVVDDCSTDGTPTVLEQFRTEQTGDASSKIEWIFLKHDVNRGKGRAVQTALARATCAISVIHDADLKYHPKDLLRIVGIFVAEEADAEYGSRFAGGERADLRGPHQLFRPELSGRQEDQLARWCSCVERHREVRAVGRDLSARHGLRYRIATAGINLEDDAPPVAPNRNRRVEIRRAHSRASM
jgi:glycosyltransferase involved in cell wall biosynthesis